MELPGKGWWCFLGKDAKEKDEGQKPFDSTRDPAWAQRVDTWDWLSRDEETKAKEGPCPRCNHQISVLETQVVGARLLTLGVATPGPAKRYAACNCGVKHPETPDGEIGCGANGLINRAEDR